MTPLIPPPIPYNTALNTANTIQTPSSLVDSSSVSYVVLLISNGLISCHFFTSWLSMTLVIIGLILNMFGSILNSYGSDIMPFHHSDFTPIFFP